MCFDNVSITLALRMCMRVVLGALFMLSLCIYYASVTACVSVGLHVWLVAGDACVCVSMCVCVCVRWRWCWEWSAGAKFAADAGSNTIRTHIAHTSLESAEHTHKHTHTFPKCKRAPDDGQTGEKPSRGEGGGGQWINDTLLFKHSAQKGTSFLFICNGRGIYTDIRKSIIR